MEKSANTISERKYRKMSDRQRHKVLSALAKEALARGEWPAFQQRYQQLQTWVPMDYFQPPTWLTPSEALADCQAFHARLAGLAEILPTEQTNESTSWQARHSIVLACDRVRSPYNVGSMIRLADNFGLARVVHPSPWLDLNHAQLQKSARGSQAWVPIEYQADLPQWLDSCGMPIVGLETGPEAIPLTDWQPPEQMVLVVGHEASGISEQVAARCHDQVAIPMYGFKRSMNVSHALAVCLWHVTQTLAHRS